MQPSKKLFTKSQRDLRDSRRRQNLNPVPENPENSIPISAVAATDRDSSTSNVIPISEMNQNVGGPAAAQPLESATSSNTGAGTITTPETLETTLGLEYLQLSEQQGGNTPDNIELGRGSGNGSTCIPENRISPCMAWMNKYKENPNRLEKFHIPKPCGTNPKIPTERQEMAGNSSHDAGRRKKLGRMDPPKIFECPTCGKKYDNQLNFDAHARHHNLGIRCKYCIQSFECRTELLPHELLKIYTQDKREDNFVCTFCLEIFESY